MTAQLGLVGRLSDACLGVSDTFHLFTSSISYATVGITAALIPRFSLFSHSISVSP